MQLPDGWKFLRNEDVHFTQSDLPYLMSVCICSHPMGGEVPVQYEIFALQGDEFTKQINAGPILTVEFQTGPLTAGVRGVLDPILAEIIYHRAKVFSEGSMRCRETSIVRTKLKEVLLWMRERVERRKKERTYAKYKEGSPQA